MEAQVQKGPPDILKLVFTDTADERPGGNADDGFVTTESALAASSGEAAERENKRLDQNSPIAVAKLIGEAQYYGIA